MSYPDPPSQPPWTPPGQQPPGPPPPGAAYPQPHYGAPRKNRTWMIPVAGVAGVALMASSVWAANHVMDDLFVGPQPETVLPASSVMFAKLDLRPSGGQLANYAQFVDKLPDELRDEVDPESDPAEPIFDELLLDGTDLRYERDVQSWFGQRFGFAMWPADNEDAAVDDDGLAMALALAVEDEGAAEETLDELRGEWDDLYYEIDGDFAILSTSDAALDEHAAQVDRGTLADESDFSADMNAVGGDSLAAAWLDLEALSELDLGTGGSGYGTDPWNEDPWGGSDPFSEFEEATGRMAMALKVEADYVELRGDMFDVTVDGVSMSEYEVEAPGIDVLGELPDNTVMAMGGNNLEQWVSQAWEDDPDAFAELGIDDAMTELGVDPPEGFADLLGSRTAFGITDFDGMFDSTGVRSSDPSFQYRATGAEAGVLEEIVTEAGQGGYGSAPGVDTEGDTTVVSYGRTGTGRLGDDPLYQQAMQDMAGAGMGFYLDLRAVAEEDGTHGADQFGAIGAAMSLDGDNASFQARWAPSGG